jgi:phosphotransferase system HPr-like phosphotransfer protein
MSPAVKYGEEITIVTDNANEREALKMVARVLCNKNT